MNTISFLFIGQIIPQKLLNDNFELLKDKVDIAGNTFYTTLLEGLCENGCRVYAESQIDQPINDLDERKFGRINYKYTRYINNNFCRFLAMFFRSWKNVGDFRRTRKEEKAEKVVIFNVLRISASTGALLACKFFKLKTIGIVTDVPGYRVKKQKTNLLGKISDKIGQFILNKFDSYVLLSEAMTNIINVKNKPYVVIEGIYDEEENDTVDADNINKKDNGKFSLIYAGSLHYQYGIMNLVKAVSLIRNKEISLYIYGKGEAEDEIKEICSKDEKIHFGGLISRNELQKIERAAALLVNPRPVEDEYVKYSFPSKNMEYMASGTPVILTDIASLPEEYKSYIILAENNSVDELKEKIQYSYEHYDQCMEMGNNARVFIIKNKNKTIQSKKVLELCR